MPVPGIWKPDRPKTGQKNPDASLDRFGMNKLFFMTLINNNVLVAILFLPFEIPTNKSSPDHLKSGLTSLDRFINKGHKKYFIHAKTV